MLQQFTPIPSTAARLVVEDHDEDVMAPLPLPDEDEADDFSRSQEGAWEAPWEAEYRKAVASAAISTGKLGEAIRKEEEEGDEDEDAQEEEDENESAWALGTDRLKLFGNSNAYPFDLEPCAMSDSLGGHRLCLVYPPLLVHHAAIS
jgi:hypothetical protein